MIDPTQVPVEEQKSCIEVNANHIIKSLEFAKKKLEAYYHGGGEMNGMSYNAMLKLYNMINNSLESFESINNRVSTNVENKSLSLQRIPRRKIN